MICERDHSIRWTPTLGACPLPWHTRVFLARRLEPFTMARRGGRALDVLCGRETDLWL